MPIKLSHLSQAARDELHRQYGPKPKAQKRAGARPRGEKVPKGRLVNPDGICESMMEYWG